MSSANLTFTLPASAAGRVRQMVEATNARAALHGLDAYTMEITAPFLADYHDPRTGRLIGQRPTVTMTLRGAVPRHQGWTVLARLDHDAEGETITSLFPGLSDQDAAAVHQYKAVENLCHGCRVGRHRTATYLARHEGGEFRQLGTTCVEPYTGLPIKGLTALWRFGTLKDSDWDEKNGDGFPTDLRLPVDEVLRVTAAVVAEEGRYYSRSEEWRRVVPTATVVDLYFFGRKVSVEWRASIDANAEARRTATAVRQWAAQGYGTANDYRHKIGQLAKGETVDPRHLPTLVSAIAGWNRDQDKAKADHAARNSTAQGTKGERLNVAATVTAVVELEERHYGYHAQRRRLVKFQDQQGNVYVWFSSAATVPEKGDDIELTGTVKDHSTYGEVTQTVLTRCRLAQRQPATAGAEGLHAA
jgi:hypothetical protein